MNERKEGREGRRKVGRKEGREKERKAVYNFYGPISLSADAIIQIRPNQTELQKAQF